MKKIFISGATGYIGSRLALELAEQGNIIHALYRSEEKTKYIQHSNIKLFMGDLSDPLSLQKAIRGCAEIYHLAAYARVWTPDPSTIYHLNIEGAMNVIKVARDEGVEKIVVSSTAGVFGSSGEGVIDEEARPQHYFLHYEHSKAILESAIRALAGMGSDIVIVNPSRVYGPGMLSESNGVTRMIKRYLEGKWKLIPGNGKSTGNYVFIDDVLQGHILAMKKGKSGENYILGGQNSDYCNFFHILSNLSGRKQHLFKIPVPVIIAIAEVILFGAKLFNRSPLITPPLARKYSENFNLSSEKAQKELGYQPLSLEEGLEKTIEWLRQNAQVE